MIAAGAHSKGKIVAAMRNPDGSTWLHRWPDLFDGLTAEQRRIVITAVADNVLEGWRPSRADIQALVDVVCGNTTTEDYTNTVRTGTADR
jgi:antitoxin VbhA-like protein